MLDDLPVEFVSVSDEAIPTRLGDLDRTKKYVFFVGKHGPFTERVPLEQFDDTEIGRRVERLKAHLRTLPT